jgi:hypothetical protein
VGALGFYAGAEPGVLNGVIAKNAPIRQSPDYSLCNT